jgi:hypothetical protein
MADRKRAMTITENPLAGGSFRNWLGLLRENGGIDRQFFLRTAYVTLMTAALLPLRLAQRALFGRRIRATALADDPVFILGHYRSGTTYLMNLLVQDRQWGFVSTTQAVVPGAFLLGRGVRFLLGLFLPDKRPMDDMAQSPTLPEEPEHAIGNLSPYCFYHGLCFPRRMMHYFERWALLDGASERELADWRSVYLQVLQAATLASGGRRLVVKNPPDTARLETLLEMFPRARFVHLYRNPFVMYPSIKNFYGATIRDWQLQEISGEALHENILVSYKALMDRYEQTKHLVPAGHLLEIRFEDLERDAVGVLATIYRELGLPGFETAEPAFRAYVASQSRYRKNRYRLTPETVREIEDRWRDQIERWGYEPPDELLEAPEA